jgi:hypothetical protein
MSDRKGLVLSLSYRLAKKCWRTMKPALGVSRHDWMGHTWGQSMPIRRALRQRAWGERCGWPAGGQLAVRDGHWGWWCCAAGMGVWQRVCVMQMSRVGSAGEGCGAAMRTFCQWLGSALMACGAAGEGCGAAMRTFCQWLGSALMACGAAEQRCSAAMAWSRMRRLSSRLRTTGQKAACMRPACPCL